MAVKLFDVLKVVKTLTGMGQSYLKHRSEKEFKERQKKEGKK